MHPSPGRHIPRFPIPKVVHSTPANVPNNATWFSIAFSPPLVLEIWPSYLVFYLLRRPLMVFKAVRIYSTKITTQKAHLLKFCIVAGLIFVPQANEKYFDLAGSIGFLTSTVVSIYYPTLKERYWYGNTAATLTPLAPRQLLLNAAIGGWAVRLGAYLFWVRYIAP